MNNFHPKIVIPSTIDRIITHLTHKIGIEFTLFGKTRYENGAIHLIDIRVPEQVSSGADTEISPDALEKFMEELINDDENPKDWNMWIHSHNTMGAFWSGTDTTQMNSFNTGGPDYFAHMVVSTKGRKAALSQYKPFNLCCDDIQIEVVPDTDTEENPRIPEIMERAKVLKDELDLLTKEYSELTSVVPERAETILAEVNQKNKTKQQFLPLNEPKHGKKGKKYKAGTPGSSGLSELEEYYDDYDGFENTTWRKPTGVLEFWDADKSYYLDENFQFWHLEYKRLSTAVEGHAGECSCRECRKWTIAREAVKHYDEVP